MLRVSLGGQPLLDVGVEQPHLGLGQPSQAVTKLPGRPQQGGLVAPQPASAPAARRRSSSSSARSAWPGCGLGSSQASKRRPAKPSGNPAAAAVCSRVVVSRAVGSGNTTPAQSRLYAPL